MRIPVSALSLLILLACDGSHSHDAPKEPEEKTGQVTVWGDRFEIFAEHKLIVAGVPTTFVTHVTDLKTLEPRREGPVTFVMQLGTDPHVESTDPAPARAGIYTPKLTFSKPGAWDVSLRIPIDGAESVVLLPRFTVYASKDDAQKAPEQEAPEGISFLKEQQWKVLTKTEPVARRRLVERLRVPATVTARPGARALVVPPIAGRILTLPGRSMPSLGERVEAGQALAMVQPPFSDLAVKIVEAEANVVRAKLALDQAELSHARIKRLVAENAKPERELQEADFAVRSARAAHETAVALRGVYEKSGAVLIHNLPVLELKSPIAGIVVQIGVAIGEFVDTERSAFTVLDASVIHIEARIAEADIPRLAATRGALYETQDARGRFETIPTEPVFVGLDIDPSSRTLPVVYEVKNADGRLRAGQALTLHIESARAEDALAVPLSAIVDEDARPIAFVQLSGETFEKRHLKLGIRDGDFVQVLDGLGEGDRVTTKDAFAIRLASVSSVIPAHGHAH